MIPLKLHITNFLSYGAPQDIDFEPYPLICLSGKNGHGKSSLLDALTWVLWGQARKASGVAKADEGLLHLGKTHMMVILDFMCNGILYRVKREFTQSAKKGQSNLEFGILEPETGNFKALTDKTIRATQDKIIHAIGLDYEGFINSAFIRQGQSHEFSKKSPKERKDILAALLGLEHFERVRRLALDTAKESQNAQELAQAVLKSLEEELKEKQLIQDRLTLIDAAMKQSLESEKELLAQYEINKTRLSEAHSQKVETEKILYKSNHLAKVIEEELRTLRSQVTTWRQVLKRQRHEGSSSSFEAEREQAQKELNNLQLLGAQKLKLKEEALLKKEALRAHIQKLIDTHKVSLDTLDREILAVAHNVKSAQLKHEELTQKSIFKTAELEELTKKLIILKSGAQPNNDATISSHEKNLERRKGYYHTFISRANTLKSLLTGILQKKQLITSSEQPVCPLCEQVTDRDHLTNKFIREENLRNHQLMRLTQVCTLLKSALITEHTELESLKKIREYQQVLHVQLAELEKQCQKSLSEGELLSKELTSTQEALTLYTQQAQALSSQRVTLIETFEKQPHDDTRLILETDLNRLEHNLVNIAYDPQKEQTLVAQISLFSEKSRQQGAFLRELALQDDRRRTIQEKCSQTRLLKKELEDVKKAIPTSALINDDHLITQEQLLSASLAQLIKEKESLIHQKGALEAQVNALKQKEFIAKQQSQLVHDHNQKCEEYTTIAAAFSKDGIQALLIEDALPEIEEEANNLLSRLTENQAHISIDSLRDTKSGKTKETLDIKISDAVGVRPYEMFSGGEAFRIDFALRVALAKLLARRAGTALQTLIIDEGFGSQDEDGLAYIMQALHTIREDFEKVIIVSHLPALKEQFPVHFEVEKTSQGTVVKAVEHC